MKHARKFASLLLALVMVLAMSVTAFADSGTNDNSGRITIDNAIVSQTYTIYQILALESYNAESDAYSYKATADWKNFVEGQDIANVYLKTDDQGYVTWVENADEVEFAKLAKKYTETATILYRPSVRAKSTTVEFTGLNLGYYLVDSSLGALCSLDTTNPTVTIKEKNGTPTIDKEVKEGETWGDTNGANIGDTLEFKATINVIDGQPKDYVMHDTMSDGLTFNSNSVVVTINGVEKITGTDYTVTSPATDGHTFDISFNGLNPNDVIVVTYSATLNEDAVVAGNGNTNTVKLSYKDSNDETHDTPDDTTKTYTWDVDVFKYTKDGNDEKALAGAKFTLSKKSDGTDPIALVSEGNNVYRVATADDATTITEITTDKTGKFTIKGLDSSTYYLTETAAPAGYNKLAGPITIVVGADGSTSVDNTTVNEVKVENKSGTELPSTGGMGTTIFYVVGSILLVGAAVLLIVKKRMNAEK